MRRLFRSALAVVLLLAIAPVAATEDGLPPWNGVKNAFNAALKSKEPKEKARAFEYLRGRPELDAIDVLLRGYKTVRAEGDKVQNAQETSERQYEKLLNKLSDAQHKFEDSARGPRDLETFNKSERKITAQIDEARRTAKSLENDWTRNRALLDSATDVASSILGAMEDQTAEDALSVLRMVWLEGKDPEGPMRWMDTLSPVGRRQVTQELHLALVNPEISQLSRAAAISALAHRRDGLLLEKAPAMLTLTPDDFLLVTAAVAALETMHDRRCIPPLIEFLKREDLGRLRDDAREALVSLTGQEHGPYYDPWWGWWSEHGQTFAMPEEPCPTPTVVAEKTSKTFYGIHTFSNRVLYIVDISGSMDWAPGKRGEPGGEKAKIVTLKEELIGAVNNLEDGSNFNVIAFNHEVLPWSGRGVVTASATSKKKLERWVDAITPTGLTNIHDALEAGFRLILRTTGRSDFDTVFFLTDGKPTGGKITDPEKILSSVREWNALANTRIHVIGIGHGKDIDESFLQRLAEIGGGKYVQRSD